MKICVFYQLALLAKEDEIEADFEKQVHYDLHVGIFLACG